MASSIQADTVAFCRKCGKPLTAESRRDWQGVAYCEPCRDVLQAAQQELAAEQDSASQPDAGPSQGATAGSSAAAGPTPPPSGSFPRYTPAGRYPQPSGDSVSPALAGILGFIPGVGAVYNGQFAKGILHVVIFGLLVSIVAADGTDDLRPMFAFLMILMAIYMPIEAYRTARKLERGEPAEEFSGILSVFGSTKTSPAAGVMLIVLGVVFLFNTLGYWRLGDLVEYWPVLLIALGIYMLYRSVSQQAREDRLAGFGGAPGMGGPPRASDPGPRPAAPSAGPDQETRSGGEELAEGESSGLRHPSSS